MDAAPVNVEQPRFKSAEISGKGVVLAMFVAGLIGTALIFIYWERHTRPFRALTETLGREFRHSTPKIEGGRYKQGPMTLRVSLQMPFRPVREAVETQGVIARVLEITRTQADLRPYEILEIHLIQRVPEKAATREVLVYKRPAIEQLLDAQHSVQNIAPEPAQPPKR
jgi:hypothetical protein